MDNLSPEKRSKIMRAIKSKNTKEEVLLAKSLWHRGHRYRKNDKAIFGTPDLTFRTYKIAVFVDGEFFHGKDWHLLKLRLNTNKEFWHSKIERNIARDNEVNNSLYIQGWTVLRFWCKNIKEKKYSCIKLIEKEIAIARQKIHYL